MLINVLLTMACLLTACMLVPAKTRGLGAGLALGQALAESARYINEVSPSGFDQFTLVQKLSFTGSYVLVALGGLIVALALLVERGSAGSSGTVVRMPLPVLALGIPGTVLWTVSGVTSDYVWTYPGASAQSFGCCSWSTSNGTEKAAEVMLAVAMLGVVLLAAFVIRPGLAKGLLVGVVVFQLSETIEFLVSIVAPNAAQYGIGGGGGISTSAKAGSGAPWPGSPYAAYGPYAAQPPLAPPADPLFPAGPPSR